MQQSEYRQSLIYLILSRFIFDVILMTFLIGFITFAKHWLEYTKIKITLKEKGVLLENGLFTTNTTEIPYSKINSISVRKGILGSMLGYGDIVISSGNDISGIVFKGIENPDQLKAIINSKQV